MTRRARVAVFALAAIALLGSGMALQRGFFPHEIVKVARQDLVLGIDMTGTLKAAQSNVLSPPDIPDMWDFKISMMAPEGAAVKKGAPVLGFDQFELQQTLETQMAERDSARTEIERTEADLTFQREQQELQLAEAEARLRKAELKLQAPDEVVNANERKQVLIDRDVASREVKHIRQKLKDVAKAAAEELLVLRSKEKTAADLVNVAETNMGHLTVTAPRDGTVIYVVNWRNEKKKVGDTAWRSERILEIPDLSVMTAEAEVDESDAGKVAMGQRVMLRLDAHPDDEFRGRISEIAKTVVRQSPQNPLKVLRVKVKLDRTDSSKMKPGMRFKGTIETGRLADVVVVPIEAIVDDAAGPAVVKRGTLGRSTVPLKLGKRNDKVVQVLDGIDAGDSIELPKKKEPSS